MKFLVKCVNSDKLNRRCLLVVAVVVLFGLWLT